MGHAKLKAYAVPSLDRSFRNMRTPVVCTRGQFSINRSGTIRQKLPGKQPISNGFKGSLALDTATLAPNAGKTRPAPYTQPVGFGIPA